MTKQTPNLSSITKVHLSSMATFSESARPQQFFSEAALLLLLPHQTFLKFEPALSTSSYDEAAATSSSCSFSACTTPFIVLAPPEHLLLLPLTTDGRLCSRHLLLHLASHQFATSSSLQEPAFQCGATYHQLPYLHSSISHFPNGFSPTPTPPFIPLAPPKTYHLHRILFFILCGNFYSKYFHVTPITLKS